MALGGWLLVLAPSSAWGAEESVGGSGSEIAREGSEERVPTLDEARQAFLAGRKYMKNEQWLEAGDAFALAVRNKNTPGLRYYVGICRENDGRLLEALESYEQAAELLKIAPSGDLDAMISLAIERVRNTIPWLVLPGLPRDTSLRIDGERVALEERIALDPGNHSLLIQAPGFEEYAESILLSTGATQVLKAELVELEKANDQSDFAALPLNDSAPHDRLRKGLIWGGVGLGITGFGVGAFGLALHSSGASQINRLNESIDEVSGGNDSACFEPGEELAQSCTDLESALKKKQAGTTTLVVGSVAAVAGAASAIIGHYFWPESALDVRLGGSASSGWFSLQKTF